MGSLEDENKIAFITCIELVLMRRGNTNYNLVLAKLNVQIEDGGIDDCLDHPEYLKNILKQVYKHEYNAILDEIILETERLTDMDKVKADFFKFMMS